MIIKQLNLFEDVSSIKIVFRSLKCHTALVRVDRNPASIVGLMISISQVIEGCITQGKVDKGGVNFFCISKVVKLPKISAAEKIIIKTISSRSFTFSFVTLIVQK